MPFSHFDGFNIHASLDSNANNNLKLLLKYKILGLGYHCGRNLKSNFCITANDLYSYNIPTMGFVSQELEVATVLDKVLGFGICS